jgi:tRNA nucleotidyltransferase (CCA-adding enzyme)
MDIYLVGGAVRDELLGRSVKERDWVVVGGTPEAMKALGYRQVGRDFPVFLHPETQEEYALARTERKTGPGHTGFVCHAGPEVTLEEDLLRRDLTVNAMARTPDGAVIDPFGGAADLQQRLLRHVSPAFEEDPLRVFRVARFTAQLPEFEVAPDTLALMRRMAAENQLAQLSAERVWQELNKALSCAAPERFFEVLAHSGALSPWLVELEGLVIGFPPSLGDSLLRFASLGWLLGSEQMEALCQRLRTPRRYQRLSGLIARFGRGLAVWRRTRPERVVEALQGIGAFAAGRDPESALRVVEACADVDLEALRRLTDELAAVTASGFQNQGLAGKLLGEAIARARIDLIRGAQRA